MSRPTLCRNPQTKSWVNKAKSVYSAATFNMLLMTYYNIRVYVSDLVIVLPISKYNSNVACHVCSNNVLWRSDETLSSQNKRLTAWLVKLHVFLLTWWISDIICACMAMNDLVIIDIVLYQYHNYTVKVAWHTSCLFPNYISELSSEKHEEKVLKFSWLYLTHFHCYRRQKNCRLERQETTGVLLTLAV